MCDCLAALPLGCPLAHLVTMLKDKYRFHLSHGSRGPDDSLRPALAEMLIVLAEFDHDVLRALKQVLHISVRSVGLMARTLLLGRVHGHVKSETYSVEGVNADLRHYLARPPASRAAFLDASRRCAERSTCSCAATLLGN
jgi:hypothetical protein